MADHRCPTTKPHHNEGLSEGTSKDNEIPVNRLINKPARGVSFYTPEQSIPAGTAINPQPNGKAIPKLFEPLKLRGLTLHNRIAVSPMCQYSADDGHQTVWHLTHLGGIIQRGPGLVIVEATAVVAEGRITPEDCGLWKDSQIQPLKTLTQFAHSQGQHIGIQLGHAGRKASTVAPWIDRKAVATEEANGWPDRVVSASTIPYDENIAVPKAMTKQQIENFKKDWVAAVQRALKAGFDVIEIHAAHGYLLHSFLSAATNDRTDEYGGSFENRIRLVLELVDLTRNEIPDDMPLLVRIPATDWLEHDPSSNAWEMKQTVKLATALSTRGVDLLDVSSGGLMAAQKIKAGPSYQAPFSEEVSKAIKGSGVAVGAVGMITSGVQAAELLEKDMADIVFVARAFQKNPGLVWAWAEELGVEARAGNQIGWGWGQRPNRGIKQ